MDHEFDKIENEVGMVSINTTTDHKHVAEIERMIHGIKERSRMVVSMLHYAVLTRQLVICIISFMVL